MCGMKHDLTIGPTCTWACIAVFYKHEEALINARGKLLTQNESVRGKDVSHTEENTEQETGRVCFMNFHWKPQSVCVFVAKTTQRFLCESNSRS